MNTMLRPCFDPPADFGLGFGWAAAEFGGACSDPTPTRGVANAAAESTPNSRRDKAPLTLSLAIRISHSEKERGLRKTVSTLLSCLLVTLCYLHRAVIQATTKASY